MATNRTGRKNAAEAKEQEVVLTAAEKLAKAQAEVKALREQAKAEKAAQAATPKYTRAQSVVDILLAGFNDTKANLITQADAAYATHGGKANPKESAWAVGTTLAPLLILGFVTETAGKLTYNGTFQPLPEATTEEQAA